MEDEPKTKKRRIEQIEPKKSGGIIDGFWKLLSGK
jgi:hypothetical protein